MIPAEAKQKAADSLKTEYRDHGETRVFRETFLSSNFCKSESVADLNLLVTVPFYPLCPGRDATKSIYHGTKPHFAGEMVKRPLCPE